MGQTGSGKTWAAKTIVESLLDEHRQVCIVDPTSAWWGLRLAADGKRKGYNIVLLGGEHADMPLADRSGAAVARLVTEQGASVVIDIGAMHVGQYTRWWIDFAGTLYTTIRRPLHLVIDEAHYVAPQGKVPDPDTGRMLHATSRLISGGRSRGVRGMLITQRPAKLHKDSLTCVGTLIAMRVIAPQDRSAVKDWIDGAGDPVRGKQVLDSLAQLQRGEAWVWYPEGGHLERVKFGRIHTYDSSAAPTHAGGAAPHVGEIDLSEVRAALADAVREAEANDPKLLRARIVELERKLAAQPKPEPIVERVEVRVVEDADLAKLSLERDNVERALTDLKVAAGSIERAVVEAARLARNGHARELARPRTMTAPRTPIERELSRPPPSRPSGALGRGLKYRMLVALCQYPDGLTQKRLAALAGGVQSGGGFQARLSELRTAGYVATFGDILRATPDGQAAVGDFDPLPTGAALVDYWRGRLGSGLKRAIFDALVDAYPRELGRDELEALTGGASRGGGFQARVSELRSLGLIEGRGSLRACEELFA
jgi:hypothetical protein